MPDSNKSGPASRSVWRRAVAAITGRFPQVLTLSVFERPAGIDGGGRVDIPGFALAELTLAGLDAWRPFRRPDQLRPVQAHLTGGGRTWQASIDGEPAAYAGLAVAGTSPARYRYLWLHPGEASSILMFTRDRFRGLGLGRALLRELSARAHAEHAARTMVGWTAAPNAASCRMHLRAGYAPAGTVHLLLVGYRPVWRVNRGTSRPR